MEVTSAIRRGKKRKPATLVQKYFFSMNIRPHVLQNHLLISIRHVASACAMLRFSPVASSTGLWTAPENRQSRVHGETEAEMATPWMADAGRWSIGHVRGQWMRAREAVCLCQ